MKILTDYLIIFSVGGLICALVQILINKTKITPARLLVSLVVLGVILSAVGVYEPFIKFAKAGATVPLSGFGHLIATGTREMVEKMGVVGVFGGGLWKTAGGIGAAVTFAFLMTLFFKSKPRS